jgi:hypothetical protein
MTKKRKGREKERKKRRRKIEKIAVLIGSSRWQGSYVRLFVRSLQLLACVHVMLLSSSSRLVSAAVSFLFFR